MLPYCIELEFTVLADIRTMPPFHGARWSALLRHACHKAEISMDDCILGIRPWRRGSAPMFKSERVGVRIVLGVGGEIAEAWQRLLLVLTQAQEAEGPFSLGHTLDLRHVYCGISGQTLWRRDTHDYAVWSCNSSAGDVSVCHEICHEVRHEICQGIHEISTLAKAHVLPTVYALCRAKEWQICLESPLRMPRRGDAQRKTKLFADAAYFQDQPQALQVFFEKIRHLDCFEKTKLEASLVTTHLAWHDMRYNADRKIALGGLVGTLSAQGRLDFASALRLVLGQYTGVGKNARFGLGYYTVTYKE